MVLIELPGIDPEKQKALIAQGFFMCPGGGEEGDRTLDLRIANAALSQLSYPPTRLRDYKRADGERKARAGAQAPAPQAARRRRSATAAHSPAAGTASASIRETPSASTSRSAA